MLPIIITSGEPAGIGPDLCLQLGDISTSLVILGDQTVFKDRAQQLGLPFAFEPYSDQATSPYQHYFWHIPTPVPVSPGQLDVRNSSYVLQLLDLSIQACMSKQCRALVTAPVHKGIIHASGVAFSGHTEYLAQATHTQQAVMLLVSDKMKVALITTHIPLSQVSQVLTMAHLTQVIHQVHTAMQKHFHIMHPRLLVAGLNPHAGENGYIGQEEVEIIAPVITLLQSQGMDIDGPCSADTLFLKQADVLITMYHDQGLPVFKYASFGEGVNVTLGLPFVRTSVDHGTALTLAGKKQATANSLKAAITLADKMSYEN